MESVERKYAGQCRAFERAQSTAGIGKIVSQNGLPRASGNPGTEFPDPGILSADAMSTDKIHLLQQSEHAGQFRWIILEVAVERAEKWGGGFVKSRPNCGTLSAIAGVPESADPGIRPVRGEDLGPSGIGAAIIHQHDFPRCLNGAEDPHEFRYQGRDVFRLVVHGDNDRDLRGSEGWHHEKGRGNRGRG